MAELRIDTLRSWGWQIEVFFEEDVATTSMTTGLGHNWVMLRLQEVLGIDESNSYKDVPSVHRLKSSQIQQKYGDFSI